MGGLTTVAIALGSNLGDRRAHLDFAVSRLRRLLENLRVSSYIETAPVDVPGPQPPFLNAAAVGDTSLAADELLRALLEIESERGRQRPHGRAARTLDLDLIFYGRQIIERPGLVVPHPRFRERQFVLGPLAEIAPGFMDPKSGRTIRQLIGDNTPHKGGVA